MSLLKCHSEISECLEKYDRKLVELLKIIRTEGRPTKNNSYRILYRDKGGNTGSVRLDLDDGFACDEVVSRLSVKLDLEEHSS